MNIETAKMIDDRNQLVMKEETPEIKKMVEALDKEIGEKEVFDNREKIMKYFKSFSDNPESINLQEMWKINKKLWPKCGNNFPAAKKNHKGKLVSIPGALKKLLAKEYKDRLRKRPTRPDFLNIQKRRKYIF